MQVHHNDVAYQGIVAYRPQPVAVSDFYRSTIGPPLINDARAIGPRIYIPGCRACPRYPRTRTTGRSSAYRSIFLKIRVHDVSLQVNQFNQEHDLFGYFPQHVAPGPPQAAFPHPFVHRIPTPNQARAENLRRLAARYLDHPSALVRMVCTEEGTAGGFKTVIILETPNIP